MMRFLRLFALFLAPAVSLFGAVSLPAAAQQRTAPQWTSTVRLTATGSHVIGNPAAKLKLVEYVSYTCPHCAHFQEQSDAALRTRYVQPGSVSVEVRHLVRDPIDLTAAVLANCGDPARFWGNHHAFLAGQSRWMPALQRSTEAQRKRWGTGPIPARLKAIAADMGFHAIMAQRGYTRAQGEQCLGNQAIIDRLVAQTRESASVGVDGTPSFLLDGALLAGTHDWASLEPQLQARI